MFLMVGVSDTESASLKVLISEFVYFGRDRPMRSLLTVGASAFSSETTVRLVQGATGSGN